MVRSLLAAPRSFQEPLQRLVLGEEIQTAALWPSHVSPERLRPPPLAVSLAQPNQKTRKSSEIYF